MFDKLFENIGKGSVEEAREAANEVVTRLDPLIHGIMNRAGGIIHGVLDRLDGTTVTIHIPKLPKATKVE